MEAFALNSNEFLALSEAELLCIDGDGWGSALIGAAGGALTGAEVGGLVGHPVVGAAIGAGLGFWYEW